MEIFVDFGLFELLIALGLASASRTIFSHRRLAVLFLIWSALAPIAVLVVVRTELVRWLAVASLVPALINVAALVAVMRHHNLAELLSQRNPPQATSRGG